MSSDLESEIKRLKNLKNFRKTDTAKLERIAKVSLWKKQIDIGARFSDKDARQVAVDKFDAYINNYQIENFDDAQNVANLIFEEVLHFKTQCQIDKIVSDEKSNFNPGKLIETLHDIEERIWKLKEKIGISKNKAVDDLTALEELKKKFNVYIPFHRNEFTLFAGYKCSGCGKEDVQSLLLRRRVKDFEVLKHPFFSGRYTYNLEIMKDVREEKITKEMAARYLKVSPQYISWALENEYKIVQIEGVPQDQIDAFVDECPHLLNSENYKEE